MGFLRLSTRFFMRKIPNSRNLMPSMPYMRNIFIGFWALRKEKCFFPLNGYKNTEKNHPSRFSFVFCLIPSFVIKYHILCVPFLFHLSHSIKWADEIKYPKRDEMNLNKKLKSRVEDWMKVLFANAYVLNLRCSIVWSLSKYRLFF